MRSDGKGLDQALAQPVVEDHLVRGLQVGALVIDGDDDWIETAMRGSLALSNARVTVETNTHRIRRLPRALYLRSDRSGQRLSSP